MRPAAESLPIQTTQSTRRKDNEAVNAIQVRGVSPLWMEVTKTERCARCPTLPALLCPRLVDCPIMVMCLR